MTHKTSTVIANLLFVEEIISIKCLCKKSTKSFPTPVTSESIGQIKTNPIKTNPKKYKKQKQKQKRKCTANIPKTMKESSKPSQSFISVTGM